MTVKGSTTLRALAFEQRFFCNKKTAPTWLKVGARLNMLPFYHNFLIPRFIQKSSCLFQKKTLSNFSSSFCYTVTSGNKIQINRYFCHITIKKWSQNCTRTIRKCFLCAFFVFSLISYWNPHYNFFKVATGLNMVGTKKQKLFWNQESVLSTSAPCMYLVCDKVWNKNHPIIPSALNT